MRNIQFPITIKVLHEKDAHEAPFIAYIPEFDISSCAKSEAKAVANAKEALDIVLDEVKRKGQLSVFLRELGYQVNGNNPPVFPKVIIEQFAFSP